MGLFDLFDNIKDVVDVNKREKQEREDKKERIDEYNKIAREYVSAGKEVYNNAYTSFSDCSWRVENKIHEHYDYKRKIINEIRDNVTPIVNSFKSFNIDNKIIQPSMPNAISDTEICISDFGNFSSVRSGFIEIISVVNVIDLIFDWARDLDEELSQARSNKYEAELYRSEMRQVAERLYLARSQLHNIESFISDERRTLDSLMAKLRPMVSMLKRDMTKSLFTQNEADYLKGIGKISDCLTDLISIRFLSDNFHVTNEYQLVFNKVKSIELTLSSVPVIPADMSSLNILLKILQNPVVY